MNKTQGELTVTIEYEGEISKICETCYEKIDESNCLTSKCLRYICKPCFKSYISYLFTENIFFPIPCPFENCNEDVFYLARYILSQKEYLRIKSIRKIRKKLRYKNLIWCKWPNCEGYFIYENLPKGRCHKCRRVISLTNDPIREDILKHMLIVDCPCCGALISKEIKCLIAKCICGTQFCVKCKKINNGSHGIMCMLKDKRGKISQFIVILTVYAYFLFPWYPVLFMMLYEKNWDTRKKSKKKNKICEWILGFVISPVVLIAFFIICPFYITWTCNDILFDFKKNGKTVKMAIVLTYLFSLPIIFMGQILFCILALAFLPILGLQLLILYTNN